MRRLVLTAITAAALVLGGAPVATAETATDLCAYDARRGPVPAAFVVDACVDGGSITLRNDLDVPILVHAAGDVGPPVRVYGRATPTAMATRLVAQDGEVLLPDDVVRWPLGAAAGGLTGTALQPATIPAITNALATFLPRPQGTEVVPAESYAPFAAVVRATAAALDERAVCVEGKNFVEIAACDVQATATIGRAAAGLPTAGVTAVLRVVLDAERWDDWARSSQSDVEDLLQADLRLVQDADGTAAPVPGDPAPGDPGLDPAGPGARDHAVPSPAPAPEPAPVPGPAPPAPAPPAPAPPAPAPVAPAAPAPPAGPGAGHGRGLLEAVIDGWRQLVEQQQSKGNGNGRGGRGNGRDDGRGQGRHG